MNFKVKKFERLSRNEKIGLMFDLINAFRIVKKPYETACFLQDLLTANEIRNLSIRLRIAKLLLAGKTHREVQYELHTSPVTISKVRIWLDQGGEGFKKVIEKLPLKWKIPKDFPRGPIEFHLPQTLIALSQYGIAKSQEGRTERFIRNVESKKAMDKQLKEASKQYYKNKKIG